MTSTSILINELHKESSIIFEYFLLDRLMPKKNPRKQPRNAIPPKIIIERKTLTKANRSVSVSYSLRNRDSLAINNLRMNRTELIFNFLPLLHWHRYAYWWSEKRKSFESICSKCEGHIRCHRSIKGAVTSKIKISFCLIDLSYISFSYIFDFIQSNIVQSMQPPQSKSVSIFSASTTMLESILITFDWLTFFSGNVDTHQGDKW